MALMADFESDMDFINPTIDAILAAGQSKAAANTIPYFLSTHTCQNIVVCQVSQEMSCVYNPKLLVFMHVYKFLLVFLVFELFLPRSISGF